MYAGWHEWVKDSLGRDPALASLAATAAADVAFEGGGFDAAAQAARQAWTEGWRVRHPDSDRMPGSLVLAMLLAAGGAAVGLAGTVWTISIYGELAFILGSEFLILNVVLIIVNVILFVFLRRRSKGAWMWAVALVTLGAMWDVMGQVTSATMTSDTWLSLNDFLFGIPFVGDVSTVDSGARFLGLYVGLTDGLWPILTSNWLVLHVIGIQLPILLLLLATPSRRWCRVGGRQALALNR